MIPTVGERFIWPNGQKFTIKSIGKLNLYLDIEGRNFEGILPIRIFNEDIKNGKLKSLKTNSELFIDEL